MLVRLLRGDVAQKPKGEGSGSMNAPATLTAHTAIFWCPSCEAMVPSDQKGLCAGCDSIIDLTLWQETEEAWASDARAMEVEELAPRVIVWDLTR
jgi:hypothetical protein